MPRTKAATPIRLAREKRGWSQLELCHRAKLSYNTVAFAERGGICTPHTADALSKVLGITVKSNSDWGTRSKTAKPKAKRQKPRFEQRRQEEKETQEALDRTVEELAAEERAETQVVEEVVDVPVEQAAGEDFENSGPEGSLEVGSGPTERGEDGSGIQPPDGFPPNP